MRKLSVSLHSLCLTTALGVGALSALSPSEAEACGGTFCDAGPTVMPVDQTGENIVFIQDNGRVEAHIQIQYEGEAESFAWVIPVMAVPEVRVGSDAFFQRLLGATVPTFTRLARTDGDCFASGFGCAASADQAGAADGTGTGEFGGDEGGDGDGDGGPNVVDRGIAGAFEYVILEGGTVEELVAWLDDNGYQQDPEAPDILDEYLQEGFLFMAVKLRGGAGVDEIHPLVIDYEGDEACVPIRLTRIAAKQDMGIRAFFLDQDRVSPLNYAHVELNWAQLDWVNLGANYNELVTLAVDEAEGGHGFVTEYAGPSTIVNGDGLFSPAWDPTAFSQDDPTNVVAELNSQGLMYCDEFFGCEYYHPQVEPLLIKYLPVPDGVGDADFYSCLECYEASIDLDVWDADAFSTDFDERILEPGVHAAELLDDYAYLTRLYTTLSPAEMVKDPLFHQTPDMPPVDFRITATQVTACEGPDFMELPDGEVVALTEDGQMPDLGMPFAQTIATVPPAGAPMIEEDNTDAILETIDEYNATKRVISDGCTCSSDQGRFHGAVYMLGLLGLFGLVRRKRA